MGLLKKDTPEGLAAKEERAAAARADQERQAFLASPTGQARQAYERGDQVFQCSFNIVNQQAIVVTMVGAKTSSQTADPTEILNHVCREGWELVNGDFVFVQTGQQSRDKLLSSGQNVAVAGSVVGYYLFRRCEANRAW